MTEKSKGSIRPRMGRPPKPPDEVRSERVVSFLTPGELDALVELADARGASISAVVHQILRAQLVEQKSR